VLAESVDEPAVVGVNERIVDSRSAEIDTSDEGHGGRSYTVHAA
jgi:hypothetical protein